MSTLFEEWETSIVVTPVVPAKPQHPNPCVNLYGLGPEGRQCKDCIHLENFHQEAYWHKCKLRAWKAKASGTVYPGKDHRVRWQACAKFEEKTS